MSCHVLCGATVFEVFGSRCSCDSGAPVRNPHAAELTRALFLCIVPASSITFFGTTRSRFAWCSTSTRTHPPPLLPMIVCSVFAIIVGNTYLAPASVSTRALAPLCSRWWLLSFSRHPRQHFNLGSVFSRGATRKFSPSFRHDLCLLPGQV